MTAASDYTLAELCIVAASKAFENDGEVLATGIGVIPRLAASLAMKTTNPDLMMTDSEAWMLSEPNPPIQAMEAVSARAVRAQSDAERAIFYLESAELLEHAGALDQARRAYQAADLSSATDDAQIVERQGVAVTLVEDSPLNLKITTKPDLKLAEQILKVRPAPKPKGIGNPFADDDLWR